MTNTNEQKNYAALRYSRSFGKENDKISLAFNREEIIKWFQDMKSDDKGIVRVCIAPRRTPSEANKFTMFEDLFRPKPASERPQRMSREQVQEKMQPAKDAADDGDTVPF